MAEGSSRKQRPPQKSAAAGVVDAFLKLSLALGVLMAGGGVGYYYAVFLPKQAVRAEERAAADARSREEAASRARIAEERRRQDARNRQAECTANARNAFASQRVRACRARAERNRAAFLDCADDFFASEEACRARYPAIEPGDCTLSAQLEEQLAYQRDERIAQCNAMGGTDPGA